MTKSKNVEITRTRQTMSDLYIREGSESDVPSRTITGYAVLFSTLSAPLCTDDSVDVREIIHPTAITKELLNGCDIKMTMFHDRQMILARSRNGAGTLSYEVDEKGVSFSFDAPNTIDGDKALELVRRGDISGCSFMFTTCYYDNAYVARDVKWIGGKKEITYIVNKITGVHDFTLAADPAYPDTNCETEARELCEQKELSTQAKEGNKVSEQVCEMRRAASQIL